MAIGSVNSVNNNVNFKGNEQKNSTTPILAGLMGGAGGYVVEQYAFPKDKKGEDILKSDKFELRGKKELTPEETAAKKVIEDTMAKQTIDKAEVTKTVDALFAKDVKEVSVEDYYKELKLTAPADLAALVADQTTKTTELEKSVKDAEALATKAAETAKAPTLEGVKLNITEELNAAKADALKAQTALTTHNEALRKLNEGTPEHATAVNQKTELEGKLKNAESKLDKVTADLSGIKDEASAKAYVEKIKTEADTAVTDAKTALNIHKKTAGKFSFIKDKAKDGKTISRESYEAKVAEDLKGENLNAIEGALKTLKGKLPKAGPGIRTVIFAAVGITAGFIAAKLFTGGKKAEEAPAQA